MNEWKLKVGQKWRTRRGDLVTIFKLTDHSVFPFYGKHENGTVYLYTISGSYYRTFGSSPFDLIELIEDAEVVPKETKMDKFLREWDQWKEQEPQTPIAFNSINIKARVNQDGIYLSLLRGDATHDEAIELTKWLQSLYTPQEKP